MTQRGFLLAGPALYAAVAAGVVIVGLSVALKVQSARLDTAKAELALCTSQYNQALASIQRQNEAVKAQVKARTQAKAKSEAALKAATQALKASQSERDRLKGLATKPATGPCQAGEAVQEIRKGLK